MDIPPANGRLDRPAERNACHTSARALCRSIAAGSISDCRAADWPYFNLNPAVGKLSHPRFKRDRMHASRAARAAGRCINISRFERDKPEFILPAGLCHQQIKIANHFPFEIQNFLHPKGVCDRNPIFLFSIAYVIFEFQNAGFRFNNVLVTLQGARPRFSMP